ncbi:unnamed protein product, partial [Prorocentrum cordatum]
HVATATPPQAWRGGAPRETWTGSSRTSARRCGPARGRSPGASSRRPRARLPPASSGWQGDMGSASPTGCLRSAPAVRARRCCASPGCCTARTPPCASSSGCPPRTSRQGASTGPRCGRCGEPSSRRPGCTAPTRSSRSPTSRATSCRPGWAAPHREQYCKCAQPGVTKVFAMSGSCTCLWWALGGDAEEIVYSIHDGGLYHIVGPAPSQTNTLVDWSWTGTLCWLFQCCN